MAKGPAVDRTTEFAELRRQIEIVDVDMQELTFFTIPTKLLAGAKLVSLHIQIDKLMS